METVLRLGGLIAGIFIIGSAALSVFTALVVPRVTSSRAMRTVAKVIGGRRAAYCRASRATRPVTG